MIRAMTSAITITHKIVPAMIQPMVLKIIVVPALSNRIGNEYHKQPDRDHNDAVQGWAGGDNPLRNQRETDANFECRE